MLNGLIVSVALASILLAAFSGQMQALTDSILSSARGAVDLVTWLVAGGVPLLVLVAGGFTYLFAGRALRPVEDMRSRVAGMGDKDLSQRVDEPAARDEVGRLARTMNQMLGRIESSQATQRRFVADAAAVAALYSDDNMYEPGIEAETIERNLEIVPRSLYAVTALAEGDRIELVQFVGGG